MRIVALGDSLTSGYGLPKGEDYVTKLQDALIAKGINVRIENAGKAGSTSAEGLARLESAIAGDEKPRLVILALGSNDMLQRISPETTKKNLTSILQTLQDKKIPVYLIGMKNPMGNIFMRGSLAKVFDDLDDEFDVPFYPYFLKGVALEKGLNLADGIHPNEKGIAIMVENTAPGIAKALKK